MAIQGQKNLQQTMDLTPMGEKPKHRGVLRQLIPSKRTYYVDSDQILIGSAETADVCLYSELVSPIHAVLEWNSEKQRATLFDFGSEQGVRVNKAPKASSEVLPGDTIEIGPYVFQWSTALEVNPSQRLQELRVLDSHIQNAFVPQSGAQDALEVVLTWQGSIRDVKHYSGESPFLIGTKPGAHLLCPLPTEVEPRMIDGFFQFASRLSESRFRVFIPGGASARGALSGQYQEVPPAVREVLLEKGDYLKIRFGHFEIYLRITKAPKTLTKPGFFERDPLFRKLQFGSFIIMLGVLVGSLYLEPPSTFEVEDVSDRVAAIVYQSLPPIVPATPKPEVKAERPRFDPTPEQSEAAPKRNVKVDLKASDKKLDVIPEKIRVGKSGQLAGAKQKAPGKQSEAKEGAGARAKGAEGMRGEKNAPQAKMAQNKAKRTSSQGGAGLGGGSSQVEDQGNVDLIKSAAAQIQGLLGNTASKLGKGGQELQGFGNFSTLGKGGAALAGSGKGGGGDAEGLGGLAQRGRGGGRVGTGLGAAGSGAGVIGGQNRVALRLGGEGDAVVLGSIDKSAIAAAIEAHKDEFRACYEREINAETPNLKGTIKSSFVIGPSGRVTEAGIESSTLENAEVQRCVVTVIKRIQFPIPEGAGQVTVTYPFKFVSSSGK